MVIDGNFTVGQLVAFQMLSGRVTGPLLRLVQLWQNLQQVLLSVDRIGDILNVNPEAEPGTGLVLPSLEGEVSFDQVFFRYKPNTEPVLKGISFNVEPGQFIGIVGRSGSGKSTLSKLLQRLYLIESGRILIDGFDVKSVDLASLRQQIGVVLQEDFLFNGSILENITLGNPEITAEQVVQAAKMAVADNFISELPQGYESNVGERGTALSGGQRQRVALARLFLLQAPILVLDEATSALDSETEQQVLQNLKNTTQGKTVFLIAHRFAPLKRADMGLIELYAGDERVARMTTSFPHPIPPGMVDAFVSRAMEDAREEDVWVIDGSKSDAADLMGLIALKRMDREQSEISYWVAPPYWHTGLASDAVQALVEANPLGNHTMFASVFQDNPASARVLTHCGFQYLGDAQSFSLARDTAVPTWTYLRKL